MLPSDERTELRGSLEVTADGANSEAELRFRASVDTWSKRAAKIRDRASACQALRVALCASHRC